MNPQAIFGPVLALMLLTCLVWVYMYAQRIPFIVRTRMRPEQMTPIGFAQLSPPAVANPSDNLKNLFELPTLFYALCLVLYAVGRVDPLGLFAAWWFVAFRYAHSVVHCTFNHILLRFAMYALSAAALWFMVLRAVAWVLWRIPPGGAHG
jgi:hypothetical protein